MSTLKEIAQNKLDAKFESGRVNAQKMIIQLQNELDQSRDFLAPFGRHEIGDGGIEFGSNGHLRMNFQGNSMTVHNHAVTQLGAKLGIPTAYLNGLADGNQEKRDLAAYILNSHRQWMDDDKRFLLRAVGDEVRGVLSNSYKRMDSKMVINSFLQEVRTSEAKIADAHFEPTRYWIEALIPYIIDIPTEKNGIISMAFGVRVSNSDFGDGALDIRSFMFQAVCTNGMVRESMMNKVHLGKRLGENIALSAETYMHESKMMASAVRDVTKLALDSNQIRANIKAIQVAADTNVNLEKEFLRMATRQVQKGEIVEIARILTQNDPEDGLNGEATLWKLCQGITAYARNVGGRRERELAQIAGELFDSRPMQKLSLVS